MSYMVDTSTSSTVNMVFYARSVFATLAMLLVGARAVDITAEMNSGWIMGLRPRQETQNLQTFAGTLGGVSASAVCLSLRHTGSYGPWRGLTFESLDYQLRGPRATVCR